MRRVEFMNPVPLNTSIQYTVIGYDDADNIVFTDIEVIPVTSEITPEYIQNYINRRIEEHLNKRLELVIKAKELVEQLGG